MHIPDGFVSPATYLPAAAAGAALLFYAFRRVDVDTQKLPFLAGVSAISFVMMLILIPFPGGTTVHLSGIAIISLLFGPWAAFLSLAFVLLIQTLLFGEGGVTSYPINLLALAFMGSFSAYYGYLALKRLSLKAALFFAGWISLVVPSIFVAFILGLQPHIAVSADGAPLYFPFGWAVTFPAVVIPHMLLGVLEGGVTMAVVNYIKKRFPKVFDG